MADVAGGVEGRLPGGLARSVWRGLPGRLEAAAGRGLCFDCRPVQPVALRSLRGLERPERALWRNVGHGETPSCRPYRRLPDFAGAGLWTMHRPGRRMDAVCLG